MANCNVLVPGGPVQTFEKVEVKHARAPRYLTISQYDGKGRNEHIPTRPATTDLEYAENIRRY